MLKWLSLVADWDHCFGQENESSPSWQGHGVEKVHSIVYQMNGHGHDGYVVKRRFAVAWNHEKEDSMIDSFWLAAESSMGIFVVWTMRILFRTSTVTTIHINGPLFSCLTKYANYTQTNSQGQYTIALNHFKTSFRTCT